MLIVGLGPAGFTLAHHLMNDGHTIVAVDGLKIEPLDLRRVRRHPVRARVETLFENLDDRVMAGFGGVAEYGITVRWNKNYLKLVRLLLERRTQFAHFGGIRFGGGATLSMDDAWAMGFDHIALCMGAGKPTVLDMTERAGARRPAGLRLPDGAAADRGGEDNSSIANLQLRMPVVVIGGGLTAIDTATESLAYYVRSGRKVRAALPKRWRPTRARCPFGCAGRRKMPKSPTNSSLTPPPSPGATTPRQADPEPSRPCSTPGEAPPIAYRRRLVSTARPTR